jgi:phosphoglycolate phosphatase-like HAD superfamily hydrolase
MSQPAQDTAPERLEIVNPDHPRGPFHAVIFDFDGTLSLLRRNWQEVMIPMMVEILAECETNETTDQLHQVVEEFVMRLNGRQTIYQMIQLAEEVESRGGNAKPPLQYKQQYHDRLWKQVCGRVDAVRSGRIPADEMTVPGCRELLDELSRHDLKLYLASGTDLVFVQDELEVLGLTSFFEANIHGALDDFKKFSKAMLIKSIIRDEGLSGAELIGFGDGFVEIEEIKRVGGLAIGVASDEVNRCGINAWKRERLIKAGADMIIGDYRNRSQLLRQIG